MDENAITGGRSARAACALRRALALLCAAALACGMLPEAAFAEAWSTMLASVALETMDGSADAWDGSADAWDGSADASWYGAGDAGEYELGTAGELAGLAKLVNSGEADFAGETVSLSADIDLSGAQWVPVGISYAKPFKGTFDGRGHKVSGMAVSQIAYQMYVDDVTVTGSTQTRHSTCMGLLGCVRDGAVRGVAVEGAIECTEAAYGADDGAGSIMYVGGVVGWLRGSDIADCTSKVDITSRGEVGGVVGSSGPGSIERCKNEGALRNCDAPDDSSLVYTARIGGIVGGTYSSEISQCVNEGDIAVDMPLDDVTSDNKTGEVYIHTKEGGEAAGIAATALNCTVSECANHGAVSGAALVVSGFAGPGGDGRTLALADCYNTGDVTSTATVDKYNQARVAGLVPSSIGTGRTTVTTTNCYNAGAVSFAGEGANASVVELSGARTTTEANCYGAEAALELSAADLGEAWADDAWKNPGGTPRLSWEPEGLEDAAPYDVTFDVRDGGGNAFPDAYEVTVSALRGGQEAARLDSQAGCALPSGAYRWRASAEGCAPQEGVLVVHRAPARVAVVLDRQVRVAFSGLPAGGALSVHGSDGVAVAAGEDGAFALSQGRRYSREATAAGFASRVGALTAAEGLVVDAGLVAVDGVARAGGSITAGGTYYVAPGFSGTVSVKTTQPVELVGCGCTWDGSYTFDQRPASGFYVDCSQAPGAQVVLRDLHVDNGAATRATLSFAGMGNRLSVEGTVVVDHLFGGAYEGSAPAVRVGPGCALTVGGAGVLYLYKSSDGAGIGGSYGEVNGDIAFALDDGGRVFAKGTKQGALVGCGANAGANVSGGRISFLSGEFNLISNSRGAAVGGSAGTDGATAGTRVAIGPRANVSVNVDWSGSAVGGGGYAQGNDASGGTLVMSGGSLRVYVDRNAAANLAEGYAGAPIAEGLNDAAVTADRVAADGEAPAYRCVLDTAGVEPEGGRYLVEDAEAGLVYDGPLHSWGYVQEALDKELGEQLTVTSTPSNWYPVQDSCLYLYLTGEDHDLSVNGTRLEAKWDAGAKSFAVAPASDDSGGSGGGSGDGPSSGGGDGSGDGSDTGGGTPSGGGSGDGNPNGGSGDGGTSSDDGSPKGGSDDGSDTGDGGSDDGSGSSSGGGSPSSGGADGESDGPSSDGGSGGGTSSGPKAAPPRPAAQAAHPPTAPGSRQCLHLAARARPGSPRPARRRRSPPRPRPGTPSGRRLRVVWPSAPRRRSVRARPPRS